MYWEASVRVVIRAMVLISALQLTKPGAGSSDYEVCLSTECEPAGSMYSLTVRLSQIWTDEPSWSTLQSQSLVTNQQGGEFGWPEIN